MKRSIYLVVIFAFLLRMGVGLAAITWLPQVGYETKPQQAGYLFFDAYRRDSQAWELAQSTKPLSKAFDEKYASDQYGGLLWISAFIYRYLAPAGHQPLLVVLLGALVNSLGVIFVYLAAKRLSNEAGETGDKFAWISALIFAFFPEAVLLGAAQMREPFLMTFIAMAFYGLVEWQAARQKITWLWMLLAIAGMLMISPGFVLVTLIASAGWLYFAGPPTGAQAGRKFPWQAAVAALILFVVALIALTASWNSLVAAHGNGFLGVIGNWARATARYNTYLLGRSSGIVQLLFHALPPALAFPFVAAYGVLQPVLPAALLEPGIAFWRIVAIFRSLGWYMLLPLLAYAPFAAGALPKNQHRRQWLWLGLVVWGWIFIAALRGGGDQWDNPRYRVILMVWLAMLASLALNQLSRARGLATAGARRWFWRICSVEAVILLVFGHWYVWRYLGVGFNIGIRTTLVLAIGLSVLLLLADWLWVRFKPASRL